MSEFLEFRFYSSAYKLVMSFKSVFKFALANTTYLELYELVDVIYASPIAMLRLNRFLNIEETFLLNYEIYKTYFSLPYFFKDFNNLFVANKINDSTIINLVEDKQIRKTKNKKKKKKTRVSL
jgi:hypothetical protein